MNGELKEACVLLGQVLVDQVKTPPSFPPFSEASRHVSDPPF